MKGIGIIAMIVGHITVTGISRYIYLWHMPLFFLISGYFFRKKGMKECIKSNAKALLILYLIVATLLALFTSALALTGHDVNVQNAILGIFVGAESIQNSIFSDYQVGAIWFLLALFWCRVTYNFLINRYSGGGNFDNIRYRYLPWFEDVHSNRSVTKYRAFNGMAFLGRISLLILCVHLLDVKLGFASAVSKRVITDSTLAECFNLCWHIVVPLVIAAALSRLTLVRKIFQLK